MNGTHSLSRRRAIVSLGAGTLGAALVARGLGAAAQESTPTPTSSQSPLLDPAIGLIEAQELALASNQGAWVQSVELEYERGELVWEVKLSNGVDVAVDGTRGQVLATWHDDDDDDDD